MKKIFISFIALFMALSAKAQCELPNTAFQHGEKLVYELYFNWKLVWMKAGSALFLTSKTNYQNQKAFRSYLLTRTSTSLDSYFTMRDTLSGIFTENNVPLYYRKGAFEGNQYRCDEVWYKYADGKTNITQRYRNPDGEVSTKSTKSNECVYDMMSLMQRARSMKVEDFKKGERKYFKMADGDEIADIYIVYQGIEETTLKTNNDTYRCVVFSFMQAVDGKDKEIIRFFITDDDNHMPVRLDMFLKFGTAKAYLLSANGLKNPSKAKL